MIAEDWKCIPGYENKYQVSTLGNIRRLINNRVKPLKLYDNKGYKVVKFHKNSEPKTFLVHRGTVSVDQFTRSGWFIRSYNSLREAEAKTNTFNANISSCLKGKRKTANGFIWREANLCQY